MSYQLNNSKVVTTEIVISAPRTILDLCISGSIKDRNYSKMAI